MDIEELFKAWDVDCKIDDKNITSAAVDTATLHAKYMRLYTTANLKLKKMRGDHKLLVRAKTEWYKGEMAREDMEKWGWQPNPLRILKTDVNSYVEGDPDVIRKTLQIGVQEEIVGFLESCLHSINRRSFLIKNIVDWNRFQAGQ